MTAVAAATNRLRSVSGVCHAVLLIVALVILQFPKFISGAGSILVLFLGLLACWLCRPRLMVLRGWSIPFFLITVLSIGWSSARGESVWAAFSFGVVAAAGLAVGEFLKLEDVLRVIHLATLGIASICLLLGVVASWYAIHSGPAYSGTLTGFYVSKNALSFVILVGFSAAIYRPLRSAGDRLLLCASLVLYSATLAWAQSATVLVLAVLVLVVRALYGLSLRASRLSRTVVYAVSLPVIAAGVIWSGWILRTWLDFLDRDITFTGRTDIWQASIAAWRERPYWGSGWGSFASDPLISQTQFSYYGWVRAHAHSGYVQVLTELGAVGLCAIVLLIVAVFIRAVRYVRRFPSAASGWVIAAPIIFAVYNFAEQSMRLLPLFILMVAYGVTYRVTSPNKPSSHKAESISPMPEPAKQAPRGSRASAGGLEWLSPSAPGSTAESQSSPDHRNEVSMSISESPDARGREASTRYALVVARLARRWWIVVTSGLVAAVVGVGFCLLQTPIYAASATLYVTASSDSSA
ncbi:hypothetical protein GONAM_04_00005, partial [Gordonia namibiensis NBRC 108229]